MKTTKQKVLSVLALMIASNGFAESSLQSLNDDALRAEVGQALFNLSQSTDSNASTTFYKLGMDIKVEVNANIKKLVLGEGGVNPTNNATRDIDIDNMSLSGGNGPTSDLTLEKPFIELAIKNDNNPSLRSIAGVRFSAQKMTGVLQFGENTDSPNGINVFSGYMSVAGSGTGRTEATTLTQGKQLTGRLKGSVVGFPINGRFNSSSYNINIPAISVPFSLATTVNGNRQTFVATDVFTSLPTIPIGQGSSMQGSSENTVSIPFIGNVTVNTPINSPLSGSLSGLTAKIPFSEKLGFVHRVSVTNNELSLSLQNQSIQWPNTPVPAQRGWWMSFSNQINLGDVSPQNAIPLETSVTDQVLDKVNQYNEANPIDIGSLTLAQALQPYSATIPLNLTLNGQIVIPLSDEKLAAQGIIPNCYGRTFC
jgi:hypothetical protein